MVVMPRPVRLRLQLRFLLHLQLVLLAVVPPLQLPVGLLLLRVELERPVGLGLLA